MHHSRHGSSRHGSSGIGRKWRKFNRRHSTEIFIGFLVFAILLVIVLLMYLLSSPAWRARWQ